MPIILGAGLSGLSAAHYMLKKGITDIQIFEVTHRVGGWIKSTSRQGVMFEHGPHTIRPKGEAGRNTLQMIQDLKLEDDIVYIPHSHKAVKNRSIYVNNALHRLPYNLMSSLKTMSPFTKPLIKALWKDFTTPAGRNKADESVYDFANRRFGQEVADFAISPMITGICGGDAKEISVKMIMNDLYKKEQRDGGVVKGMIYDLLRPKAVSDIEENSLSRRAFTEGWSIYSLKNGLESLPRELERSLKRQEVDINFGSQVSAVLFEADHAKVVINGIQEVITEHVVSSLPPHHLSMFFSKTHPQLFKELQAIPSVSIAVVNLQYEGEILKENGFGFLIPPAEKVPILGVIYDSCIFPVKGKTILTVMLGGKWFEPLFGKLPKKEQIYDVAINQTNKILGINKSPSFKDIHILDSAIPQYLVGHNERINRIRRYIDDHRLPLSICGAAYDGVGLNDVILSARRVVDQLSPDFSEPTKGTTESDARLYQQAH